MATIKSPLSLTARLASSLDSRRAVLAAGRIEPVHGEGGDVDPFVSILIKPDTHSHLKPDGRRHLKSDTC
jgi:hypothetical protein